MRIVPWGRLHWSVIAAVLRTFFFWDSSQLLKKESLYYCAGRTLILWVSLVYYLCFIQRAMLRQQFPA